MSAASWASREKGGKNKAVLSDACINLQSWVSDFEAKVGSHAEEDWVCSKEARALLDYLTVEFQENGNAREEVVGKDQRWTKGTIAKRLLLVARARALGAPIPSAPKANETSFHGLVAGS